MFLILLSCLGLNAQPAALQSLPQEAEVWRVDLEYLGKELPKRHPDLFFSCPEAQWRKDLADLQGQIDGLTNAQRGFRTWALVRSIGDGHTNIPDLEASLYQRRWPIRMRLFQGRLHVIEAREDFGELLGAGIIGIDGLDLPTLLARMRTIHAQETESAFQTKLNDILDSSVDLLVNTGLLADTLSHDFRYQLPDGRTGCRALPVLQNPQNRTAWKRADRSALLINRNPGSLYFAESLPEPKAVYIRYRRCQEQPGNSFKAVMKQAVRWLDEGRANRIVLDLRGNGGGNSMLLGGIAGFGWVRTLARHRAIGNPRNLLVLTDGGTYSSAYMNALQARAMGGRLVGTPPGQALSNFGEVKTFKLTGLGLEVRYSSRRMGKGDAFHQTLPMDFPVETSAAEWFASRDPVLEKALELPLK